jgi:hypothetical protein
MPRHIACLTFDFDAMSGMREGGLALRIKHQSRS